MKISDIIHPEEYILSEVSDELEFNRLITDPSEISEGDLLIIPNSKRLSQSAFTSNLPVAVICDEKIILPYNIPRILVKNTRKAFAYAFFRFEDFRLDGIKIIGVTGTNGKTTTASLIKTALSGVGYKVGFIGTGKIEIGDKSITPANYSMTTPDPPLLYRSLRQMKALGCNAVVMEVSSHALALCKVAPLTFDYAVFTNLSPEHTDFHRDMEDYFNAKLGLFKNSRCSVFNIDDEYGKRAYNQCGGKKISAGIIWRGDVWASNIESHGFNGLSYTYHTDSFSFKMHLPLPGLYNAYNSLLAATVCIQMGCKPCEVKEIISKAPAIEGRYEIINDDISVIIDYAHTQEAFRSILGELFSIKGSRRLTVVFGCGGDRDRTKRPAMAKIAESYADRIIITQDNSRSESTKDIISDIIKGFQRGNYEIRENREEAIISAISDARSGDIVAIIGKGPERYNIGRDGYSPFDEREIIKRALKWRKERN